MERLFSLCALAFTIAVLSATSASAQATRTWVSGVGDDVNPCSRTAPCKTFAGAISKTAAGGEINCLDPGGFGAVTINKAMTINCLYTEGGVLAGGNGIVVNAAATDVVFLRGLDIFGVNPPSNGIRFIAGAALHVEDCTIRRFNAANSFGISFQPAGASQLFLTNVTVASNGNGATGGGILVQPTGAGGSAKVMMNNVRIQNNANNGLRVDANGNTNLTDGITVTVRDSEMSGNTYGIASIQPANTNPISIMVVDSTIAYNTSTGIITNGPLFVRVGNTTITGNTTGITAVGGSTVASYGNNRLIGNPTNGAFTGAIIPQE